MTKPRLTIVGILLAVMCSLTGHVMAQGEVTPLKLEIKEGVIEPLPFAISRFVTGNQVEAEQAGRIAGVVAADLVSTGLFREIPRTAHIDTITNIDTPVRFTDWKAINAEVLVTGSIATLANGNMEVKFRLYDVFGEKSLGRGVRFRSDPANWRRVAHNVADQIYTRVTGEEGYFDTRIAFISESGPKTKRVKRLAVMDFDGANVQYLKTRSSLVIAPSFSPNGQHLLYTSYDTGRPNVNRINIATGEVNRVWSGSSMSFAPRFSPGGDKILLSLVDGGNTDIFEINLQSGRAIRLTRDPAIDTAPGYSPDGTEIVFESDRSGTQQLYKMPATGGQPSRISFGRGVYGTPVWSPRGDYIAFTKQLGDRFHIGVMLSNGAEERLLSRSFLDEGPAWSPNGRVLIFFRDPPGESGGPSLYTVDLTGRNLRRLETPEYASDPAWSPSRR